MKEYHDGQKVKKDAQSSLGERSAPLSPTQADALLPCPFCGSRARLVERLDGDWIIQCERRFQPFSQCPVNGRTRSGQTREQAIAGWNTRAGDK